jgi:hypothetical protein
MTEYEWEIGRLPRANDPRHRGVFRDRRSAVAEYVALEFPREGVAWVVNAERDRERGPEPPAKSKTQRTAPR